MKSFDDIISAFGGPAKFGRAIGITGERAAEMRRRGSIPPDYWPRVLAAAAASDEPALRALTLDDLAAMRRPRKPPEKRSKTDREAA